MRNLLTIDEVAELLRVTDKTLRNWTKTGYGPTWYRIGRQLMYRPAEVEAWIDAQARKPAEELEPELIAA